MKTIGAVSTLTLAVTLMAPVVLAYEVDNFTGRTPVLPDSLALLNTETNRLIDAAIAAANADARCSHPDNFHGEAMPPLYAYVRNQLDGNPVATIEQWADESLPAANRSLPDFDRSIYSGMSLLDGVVLRTARLEPSIRLNGHYVGIDKLGHFMAQGYEYFERVWPAHRTRTGINYGRSLEDGMYGMETTGVRSYGDMAANFGGMNFYRDLLYGPSPMVSCVSGRYVKVRDFNWADYVNPAWDEAINCSEFNAGLGRAVSRNLTARRLNCPVDRDACLGLNALPCSEHYVSPACRALWISTELSGFCEPELAGLPTRAVSTVPSPRPSPSCVPAAPVPAAPSLLDRALQAITEWTGK